jgi:arginase family enzyme
VVRRAVEEGVVDPTCSALLGMRGGLDSPDEYEQARELGFTVVPWDDLAQLGTGVVAAAVEAIGERKAFINVDADFVDPGFAPAVGTPEVGGPSSAQALALIRGCRGLDLAGADVVEVVPELDSSNLTATVAATVAYELLSLMACSGGTCA